MAAPWCWLENFRYFAALTIQCTILNKAITQMPTMMIAEAIGPRNAIIPAIITTRVSKIKVLFIDYFSEFRLSTRIYHNIRNVNIGIIRL